MAAADPAPALAEKRERSSRRLETAESDLAGARARLASAVKGVERATTELESARERWLRAESAVTVATAEEAQERRRVAELEAAAALARRLWEETGG